MFIINMHISFKYIEKCLINLIISIISQFLYILFDQNVNFLSHKGCPMVQLEFSKVIRCMVYVMTCIKPNIAYVVGRLNWYKSNTSKDH